MRCCAPLLVLAFTATLGTALADAPAPAPKPATATQGGGQQPAPASPAVTLPDDLAGFVNEDLNEGLADQLNTVQRMREEWTVLNAQASDKTARSAAGAKKKADDQKAKLDAEAAKIAPMVDKESKAAQLKVDRLGKESDRLKEQLANNKDEKAADAIRQKFDDAYKKHDQAVFVQKRIDDYKSLKDQPGNTLPQSLGGGNAPAIEGKLLGSGDAFKLDDQGKGKAVVLVFWSLKNKSANMVNTMVESMRSFTDKQLIVVAVNVGDSADDVKKVDKRLLQEGHVLLDPTGAIAKTYKVGHMAQLVLVDTEGAVAAVTLGNGTKARAMIIEKANEVIKQASASAKAGKKSN